MSAETGDWLALRPSCSSDATRDETFEDAASTLRASTSRISWDDGDVGWHGEGVLSAGSAEAWQRHREWRRAALIAPDGAVLALRRLDREGVQRSLRAWRRALDTRSTAIRNGLDVERRHFDVHNWYTAEADMTEPRVALVYGRSGNALTGEGVGLARREDGLLLLITYGFPELSASAVTAMRAFLKQVEVVSMAGHEHVKS